MSFSAPTWAQLKSLTSDELVRALAKDGWVKTESSGAILVYRHPDGRSVAIHYHPQKTYAKLLKNLLADIGWSEDDLRRLKLVRGSSGVA